MASTWVDEEAASKMRPCQNIDPTKLKIINDPGKGVAVLYGWVVQNLEKLQNLQYKISW